MFARTSTWSGSPATLEAWAGHVTGQVAPMVKGLPGNAGAVFLIDRGEVIFQGTPSDALANENVMRTLRG